MNSTESSGQSPYNNNGSQVNQVPTGQAQTTADPVSNAGYYPPPPPITFNCPGGISVQMQLPAPMIDETGQLTPPPLPTAEEACGKISSGNDNKYINYVLPVIGILFCISLFAVYIYLLTSKKKKKDIYKDQSYSLPKMSMAIDDRELMPSNQTYSSSKLGQYKSPAISDFDLYKSPMAGNSYSSYTVVPGYNPGYIGNLSSGPYMGSQQVMIDPLYETSTNYSRNGPKGKSNRSGNMTSRYAGSDINTSADPIPNIMLSPIEPTNFNMSTNKPY